MSETTPLEPGIKLQRDPTAEPNLWRPADDLPLDQAETTRAFVIGIVGDSGSGKNTVADAVANLLGPERTTDVRLDDYHRFTREERVARGLSALNPVVHNLALMQEHLALLRQGRPIRNRSYSHLDGTFGPLRKIDAREIVLIRGLLGFPTKELGALYDLAVFLQPEPELLFRWKLRRDVHSRGYTEAEVLKSIARHLLDSKEFVLPQAARAHLHVHYELPDWEALDTEVKTTLRLRRQAAELARSENLFEGLSVQQEDEGEEVVVSIPPEMNEEQIDAWGRASFPDTFEPSATGIYTDEEGVNQRRPSLAIVEVLIALIAARTQRSQI